MALQPGDFGSKARFHRGPFEFVVSWQHVHTWLSFPSGTGHPTPIYSRISLHLLIIIRTSQLATHPGGTSKAMNRLLGHNFPPP